MRPLLPWNRWPTLERIINSGSRRRPRPRQGIADEAKNALVKAITNHGLSVEEYTSILVVAQNDPVVREKIVQRIRSSPK
jgi:hypothetical protein